MRVTPSSAARRTVRSVSRPLASLPKNSPPRLIAETGIPVRPRTRVRIVSASGSRPLHEDDRGDRERDEVDAAVDEVERQTPAQEQIIAQRRRGDEPQPAGPGEAERFLDGGRVADLDEVAEAQ